MKVIKVNTKPSYEILIREGLLEEIPEDLSKRIDFGKVAIITDTNVESLYGDCLLEAFQKKGLRAELFSFLAGEASKNIETIVTLARRLLASKFDRRDLILALGGGVVGDVSGFLASIYLRGIPYVQVPTTLLAQVDSSVGGKTGVDLPEGKNLLGTFYQPQVVYIDPLVLKTLPSQEIKNGLAEVIKYGCILKVQLFKFLKKRGKRLYELNGEDFIYLIYQSCWCKGYVVSRDEKEGGLRRILNFGHTIGHSLETLSNYQIPHGFCVAVGMALEAKLSEELGLAEKPVYLPVIKLLKELEMPFRIRDLLTEASFEEILNLFSYDKKIWKGKLTLPLLKRIGRYTFYTDPPKEILLKVLEQGY